MRFDERKTADYHAKREALRLRRAEAWRWILTEAPHLADTILEIGKVFGTKPKLNTLHDGQGRLVFEDKL